MINRIRGKLAAVTEENLLLEFDAFEYEVLVPDFVRRQVQTKTGENVQLYTIHYIDGNPTQGGRMTPRLIGFMNPVEREFFELICTVDGLGAKKALRAMTRPVQDIAQMIENEDTKGLSTLPGIGAATADRIVAKLRRKMPKFALLVQKELGEAKSDDRSVVDETFEILLSLGHTEVETRKLLDKVLADGKKYKDVDSLLHAVYQAHLQK